MITYKLIRTETDTTLATEKMLSEDEPFACNAYHNIFREPNLSRDTQLQQRKHHFAYCH